MIIQVIIELVAGVLFSLWTFSAMYSEVHYEGKLVLLATW